MHHVPLFFSDFSHRLLPFCTPEKMGVLLLGCVLHFLKGVSGRHYVFSPHCHFCNFVHSHFSKKETLKKETLLRKHVSIFILLN